MKEANPPETKDLKKLRDAAKECTACPLYKNATQTVFGKGARHAHLMIVGEQPGDKEDRAGEAFIGPAGHLLDEILEELKISRSDVYVTNAVKHFKWKTSGKIRLHQKPNAAERAACHPWLEAEVRVVQPKVILCLGVTASESVLGQKISITHARSHALKSKFTGPLGEVTVMTTWHPSAILRSPLPQDREQKRKDLKADILKAWRKIQATDRKSSRPEDIEHEKEM